IQGWCSIKDWHPEVSDCKTVEDGASIYRVLTLADGSRLKEKMIDRDADGYSYELIESDPPMPAYRAKLWVEKIREHRTRIRSTADFKQATLVSDEIERTNRLFHAGLANIKKMAFAQVVQRIGVPVAVEQICAAIQGWCSIKVWHPEVSDCKAVKD